MRFDVKQTLSNQLITLVIIIFGIISIALGILLPRVLLPVYENSIYSLLEQPLGLIDSDFSATDFKSNIAYIYITKENIVIESNNLSDILTLPTEQIIKKAGSNYGKFLYNGKTYYYKTDFDEDITKIAITNDRYITDIKKDILDTVFPVLLLTMLFVVGLIYIWSRHLINRISHLKIKVDNLDNDNYIDRYVYLFDDELKSLSNSIDEMKIALKTQEEYKNQMYQNISHDFKTPLTVIKSYIEGMEDGMQDKEEGIKIIKEQINKLELKVHSLLYLNKLNYIKDFNDYKNGSIDVSKIVKTSVEKFKIQRPDINWEIRIDDKDAIFNGTEDMWEAIIDNLLNNFIRYSDKTIKITLKKDKIVFYNDGPNIDSNILNDIFTPYKKGIKGQFGLGLSIVKKTINLLGYEINVHNEKKNGVSFIIK